MFLESEQMTTYYYIAQGILLIQVAIDILNVWNPEHNFKAHKNYSTIQHF